MSSCVVTLLSVLRKLCHIHTSDVGVKRAHLPVSLLKIANLLLKNAFVLGEIKRKCNKKKTDPYC